MSPRAAWRLEGMGFTEVYDYPPGKADWSASGLPMEVTRANEPTIGDTALIDKENPIIGLGRGNLSEANLFGTNLSHANLIEANLNAATLSHAHLFGTILSGADLRGAKNLTQEQINEANGDDHTKLPASRCAAGPSTSARS
jgi:hypothetical protein